MDAPTPPARAQRARQRLTVLFSDLSSSTAIGREMESEDYSLLLLQIRTIWREAASRRGGIVVRTQGDGATIVFGHPRPGEDDGRRATDTALEIHERVGRLRPPGLPNRFLPLTMHSGVHAGVLLIEDGDIERGRLDLIGDVANVAAHLSRQAKAGELLVSFDALGPHAHFFELRQTPALDAASEGLPRSYSVLGGGAATRRFESTANRGLTPFIGRGEIVSELTQFLSTPTSGARALVIVGNAGLGKTRLLEESLVSARPDERLVLRGGCENYLGAEVLQPFLQMARGLLGVRDGLSRDEAAAQARAALTSLQVGALSAADALLGLVAPGPDRAPGIVGDAVEALMELIGALARRRPVVLVVDDWQWADDASRRLMGALMRSDADIRALLTSRTNEDEAEWLIAARHIALEPFTGAQTAQAVRRWLPQADPFLVAQIHAYAGGVPLYVEELCHSASPQGLAQAIDARGKQGWIGSLVTSRLHRLPQACADVVRAAAAVGNVVPYASLVAACGHAPDTATLDALAEADFLFADPTGGGLRFKHGVTRDAVYDSIDLDERRAFHRRIATDLTARGQTSDRHDALGALAYHCQGAGEWGAAARFAEQAGDAAMKVFALDRARAHYMTALDALERSDGVDRDSALHWCQVANKLGMASIFDPLSLKNDVAQFERAVALAEAAGDVEALARALYWLGYMCYGFGRIREAVANARAAARTARLTQDGRLIAQIDATLGQVLTAACQYDEALPLLDAALSAKQAGVRKSGGFAVGSPYTLACKASILADRGDFAAADACFEEAEALLGGAMHPVSNSMRNWRVVALVWQGRWKEAEELAVATAQRAETMRGLLILAACRAASGYARWRQTGETSALQQLRDAVHWMEGRAFKFYVSVQYAWLVEACVETGDIAAARRYAAHILRRARHGERLGEAAACRALASAAADAGEQEACARWLRRADISATARKSRRERALNEALRGRILLLQAHCDEGRGVVEAAAADLRDMRMEWSADAALRGL